MTYRDEGARAAMGPAAPAAVETALRDFHDAPFVPCVRLFRERVAVYGDDAWGDETLPLLGLSFDYQGVVVRASDPSSRFFRSTERGVASEARDLEAEARVRRAVESYGAVDLDCLEHIGAPPDVPADYLLRCDGDEHDFCAFAAYVLPRLAALGFRVRVDEDYPWQVVADDAPWYAAVDVDRERPDWFALELGVEIDGKRVNLLPVLVDLLEDASGKSFRALSRRSVRCIALPVGDGQWVTVPKARLEGVLSVVVELHRGDRRGTERIAFPELGAHALGRLEEAFADGQTSLRFEGPTALRPRRRAPDEEAELEPAVEPAGLRATLRPYQRVGLAWLQQLVRREVGGILADDMGLGKTLQTIAHLVAEKAKGVDGPSLILAPTSLVGVWKREIEKFAPHLKVLVLHGKDRHRAIERFAEADVVVTTYPLIVRDEERFEGREVHLLVLDEAHTIKNTRSQVHRAVKRLSARHRLCLTGTPIENHLGEIWALMDFLNPGLLGDELSFRRWYRKPIEDLGDSHRLGALREQVAPFLLRRTKREVAKDLPPKTSLRRPVELEGRQRELYESIRVAAHADVRRVIRQKGIQGSAVSILDALTKLRQVCCDPRLCRMDAAKLCTRSAKLDSLLALLDEQLAAGHRALIFSQFTSMLALIGRALRDKNEKYLALTGATQKRQRVIDAFERGDADVFLISLKAGGTGLTLTSADTVIHYDPWWNPAAQDQATDRAYRIGQTKPVFVHDLFVAGSVEERMLELQQKKRRLAEALLGDTGSAKLTEDEVEYLFAPLG